MVHSVNDGDRYQRHQQFPPTDHGTSTKLVYEMKDYIPTFLQVEMTPSGMIVDEMTVGEKL